MSEKIVWVQVIDGSASNFNVEVQFRNEYSSTRITDIECIVDKVKKKFAVLRHQLVLGNYYFECKSLNRQNFWQTMSDDEEVLDSSDLRCTIVGKLPVETFSQGLIQSSNDQGKQV